MAYIPHYFKFILFSSIPLIFIFLYGKYRCENKTFKDPLEITLAEGIDGWSITHLCWFICMGYIYPNEFIPALLVGIAWELFEHFYGVYRPGWLGGYGDCDDLSTDRLEGNWWYGKWSDIACNVTGFLIGQYLNQNLYID